MGLQQSWKLDQKLVSSMVWHYDATMRDFNYTPTRLLDSLCRHLCFLLIQNEVESRVLSMSCYTRNQHTWCTKRRKFYYKQLKSSDRSTEQKLTMSKSVKKLVEETKEQGYTELELCDKSLSSIADIPGLSKCTGHSWKQKKLKKEFTFFLSLVLLCFVLIYSLTFHINCLSAQLRHLVRLTLSHNRITCE